MNCTEVTFASMLRALRQQWKVFFGCVVGFAALGVISGFIWANTLAASPQESGTVDGLLTPVISEELSGRNDLISQYNRLSEAYLRGENGLLMQKESTLTKTQQELLGTLEEHWTDFEEQELSPLRDLCMASEGGESLPDGAAESLNHAAQELGKMVYALQDALCEIAVENRLEIFVEYDWRMDEHYIVPPISAAGTDDEMNFAREDGKRLTVLHSSEERTAAECFWILTVFCLLTGLCAGGYFAICRGSREEKEIDAAKR